MEDQALLTVMPLIVRCTERGILGAVVSVGGLVLAALHRQLGGASS